MLIKVTSEHIEKGETRSPTKCPIALAIREQTGVFCDVGPGKILRTDTSELTRTPIDAFVFIRRFDNGKKVSPFQFELSEF